MVIEAVNSIREQLSLRYTNLPILRVFKIYLLKRVCVKGESNPQLNLGRVPCYHYTINASDGRGILYNIK